MEPSTFKRKHLDATSEGRTSESAADSTIRLTKAISAGNSLKTTSQ
jgi:hypothetical protein